METLIANNIVYFEYYHDGNLWYSIYDPESGDTFVFPVPIEETKGGIFKRKDKAIFFMRFIRKAKEEKIFTLLQKG